MQSFFHGIGEYLTPVLRDSKFKETGVVTPEEFVAAGDFLVYKCPTWQWASGENNKRRSFLPPNKQYLVTKNVPCLKRVKNWECDTAKNFDNEDKTVEDGWISTMHTEEEGQEVEIQDNNINEEDFDEEDAPDLEDFDMENNLINDEFGVDPDVSQPSTDDNIMRTRTYDLTITYDKYYQTPRMWLFGYDEKGQALRPSQVFEDVSQDHAKKTVTIESHPHVDLMVASIHPCKHSNVMKKIVAQMESSGKDIRVDQYLILFLKFMASVLPTIDYDYTMTMEA